MCGVYTLVLEVSCCLPHVPAQGKLGILSQEATVVTQGTDLGFLRMGSQYGTEGGLEGSGIGVSLSSAVGQEENSLGYRSVLSSFMQVASTL